MKPVFTTNRALSGLMAVPILLVQAICGQATTEIAPDSYSFNNAADNSVHGPYGPTNISWYPDSSGNELTDGVYGDAIWDVPIDFFAHAPKFVGWLNNQWGSNPGPPVDLTVNIDFVFTAPHTIQQVDIGTIQEFLGNPVIPDAEIFSSNDGVTWTSLGTISNPESSDNDLTYQTLTFSGLNITENHVRVALSHIGRENTSYGPWVFTDEIDFFNVDADNDGVLDEHDDCPDSDISPTVIIDGCDSGVPNYVSDDGCTISDRIAACAAGAADHGDFVSCVAALTNSLRKDGILTGKQKGKIQSCAGNANLP